MINAYRQVTTITTKVEKRFIMLFMGSLRCFTHLGKISNEDYYYMTLKLPRSKYPVYILKSEVVIVIMKFLKTIFNCPVNVVLVFTILFLIFYRSFFLGDYSFNGIKIYGISLCWSHLNNSLETILSETII